ncbi:MAG: cell division protein FtsZ [Alphaproteobacteria bacterium]|nr:cell division protein FtsZ [Alphaproteobacteria bacterium]
MALNLRMPDKLDLRPKITVFGVGGAGGNAVNNMIDKALEGADFVVANTDAQALAQSKAPQKIQMGEKVTEGLGAGARPSVGAAAAEESIEEIVDRLAGSHMCFITAGMGGGTGTGAAPIIARAARELGVLTVGVVTKPFQFEGNKRMRQAEEGVDALQKVVDTLIIIPNQNLFRIANEKTTFTEAFSMADDVLYQGVKGVTDLMVRPGIINLDFADVRSVMDEMGKAMMGTGEASGENRAIQAAEKAIANPLLDEISLKGARGVLINITGSHDLTLFELDEAANRIREEVDQDANIIVGSTLDTEMEGMMRVSVVATGIDAAEIAYDMPVPRRKMSEPLAPQRVEEPAPSFRTSSKFASTEADTGYEEEQPSLLDEMENDAVFADADDEMSLFDAPSVQHATDDLPPPVYQPERQQRVAARQFAEPYVEPDVGSDLTGFVAPKPPSPGNPSPNTMARLQAAVNKAPRARADGRPSVDNSASPEKSGRFGINSLINRMTGHAQEASASETSQRIHPRVDTEQATETDPEQERIDIPAFLRRQAN